MILDTKNKKILVTVDNVDLTEQLRSIYQFANVDKIYMNFNAPIPGNWTSNPIHTIEIQCNNAVYVRKCTCTIDEFEAYGVVRIEFELSSSIDMIIWKQYADTNVSGEHGN